MWWILVLIACGRDPCADDVERIPVDDSPHVPGGIDYDDAPPVGGPHDPCWADWGVHAEELPDERWVHNLEHGGIVFLYNCPDGCAADVAALEGLAAELGAFTILTPYAALPTRFGVVAWEHRLLLDDADLDAMRCFYLDHVDRAPESTVADPSESCM